MNEPNSIPKLMHELDWRTSDKMCPMTMAAGTPGKCLGHGCAWWNPHYGGCAIGTNYLTMDYICRMVGQVSDQLRQKEER